jgi:alpha-ketoglutarate-dependent taurine dioxygenase
LPDDAVVATIGVMSELQIEPISPAIGAVVRHSKAELLVGALSAALRDLLARRGLLVFPQIHFSDDEQIAFTRTLGTFASDNPDGRVTEIGIGPDRGDSGEYTKASFFWHFDGYMNPVPILASILVAETVSTTGGETEFANTYAAYEALPQERKRQIDGLRAVHSLAAAQLAVEPEPSHATYRRWLKVPSRELPLVWTHKSGRKSLVIGNTAAGIVGMDPLESRELLVFLRDWATRPEFTCRHAWSVGDAVMWDNTGTLHRAMPYPLDSGRRMRRTKLAGEEELG